ncbi:hypothetical protein FACS189440_05020 [Bacteroidia bacterium]|nr:hypothetical protein FACS189440_05020 [Bacteroidia bacterium]
MHMKKLIGLFIGLLFVLPSAEVQAQNEFPAELQELISKYYGEWNNSDYPGLAGNNRIPNTALLGNGDIGVVSGGDKKSKTFYISKGDFWTYNGSPVPIGGITIHSSKAILENTGNSLHEIQDILHAEVRTEFQSGAIKLDMRTFAAATKNIVIIEMTSKSEEAVELAATLWAKADKSNYPVTATWDANSATVTRKTPNTYTSNKNSHSSQAAMVAKLDGVVYTTRQGENNGEVDLVFTIAPGQTVYAIVAIGGGGRTYDYQNNLLTEDPVAQATDLLASTTSENGIQILLNNHQTWWKNYWLNSYILLDTKDAQLNTLMKYYYAAQYALGCNIREGKVAPGLYGLWHVTDDPSWKSDYHLNYNFISTFYGVNTSNRVEQGLPAIEAILQYIPQGKINASTPSELRKVRADFVNQKIAKGDIDAQTGISNAVLYPVGIGPWGMTLDNGYHNEALNASFSAYPLIEYYNYTKDETFLRDVLYDYLKLCVGFYEAWLEEEDGKQVLYAGYNEGSWAINPAVELSVLKSALQNLIAASEVLKIDADKRSHWQTILDHLAAQPTATYQNKSVYTLAEKEWTNNNWQAITNPVPGDGNIIPMESVIPGEQMGYYSPGEQLEVAKNTIDVFSGRGAWSQSNNFPKIFPVAVNTRYPVQTIITNLASTINSKMKANLMIEDNTHGIEKAGSTEAINNMMLLSDRNVVTVFPGWVNKDAKFVRLREKGAFVISSEYSAAAKGVVYVDVVSEAGQPFTIASPWAEGITVIDKNGNKVQAKKGTAPNHPQETIYTFNTEAGGSYHIIKWEKSLYLKS